MNKDAAKNAAKSALLMTYENLDEIIEAGLYSRTLSLDDPFVREAFEDLIHDDAGHATYYACQTGERFKLGEPAIASDPYTALKYANTVLHGRFELGEKTLAQHGHYAYQYANLVIKGRFIPGENAIEQNRSVNKIYYQRYIRPDVYRMIGVITAGGIAIITALSTFLAVVSSI